MFSCCEVDLLRSDDQALLDKIAKDYGADVSERLACILIPAGTFDHLYYFPTDVVLQLIGDRWHDIKKDKELRRMLEHMKSLNYGL